MTSPLAPTFGPANCEDAYPWLLFVVREPVQNQTPPQKSWTENLVRMGTRDVDKLLKCISRQSKKDRASLYLRNPGSCLEALAALRR